MYFLLCDKWYWNKSFMKHLPAALVDLFTFFVVFSVLQCSADSPSLVNTGLLQLFSGWYVFFSRSCPLGGGRWFPLSACIAAFAVQVLGCLLLAWLLLARKLGKENCTGGFQPSAWIQCLMSSGVKSRTDTRWDYNIIDTGKCPKLLDLCHDFRTVPLKN